MATDLTVILDDRAGQLAHMGEALGDAGVTIEGIERDDERRHRDRARARRQRDGRAERPDPRRHQGRGRGRRGRDRSDRRGGGKPGTLGRLAGKVSTAGIDVSVAYLATRDRVALVTNDNERAREALQA